jgi:predicted AlkP superfamily phosphohydrolase/phosphomutase
VAYRPEDVYREVNNVPPDLIVYFGDLDWRSVGSVGLRTVWTFENDTGPDDANHAQQGIFILHDPLAPAGGHELPTVSIYDVAPTLLQLLGQPLPAGMRGSALERSQEPAYSDEEEEIVTQRLRDLGYL